MTFWFALCWHVWCSVFLSILLLLFIYKQRDWLWFFLNLFLYFFVCVSIFNIATLYFWSFSMWTFSHFWKLYLLFWLLRNRERLCQKYWFWRFYFLLYLILLYWLSNMMNFIFKLGQFIAFTDLFCCFSMLIQNKRINNKLKWFVLLLVINLLNFLWRHSRPSHTPTNTFPCALN